MDDLYREIITDHYQNPRNRGTLLDADATYEDTNPLCGDKVRIDLKVRDGIVQDVRFSGKGCMISQAAASMVTEEIKGKPLAEVRQLSKERLLELVGIPLGPSRVKCALLSLKVLKAGAYGLSQWPQEQDDPDE